jgi:hypothetical protein
MSSVDGVLVSNGIDLRGTPSYFIDSNLRTGNRGPIDRRLGGILAKVPITKPQNGIEFYTGSVVFEVGEQSISYIKITIRDEDMQPVVFNGGFWNVSLEFDIIESRVFTTRRNFKTDINGSIGLIEDTPASERENEDPSGPNRVSIGNRRID